MLCVKKDPLVAFKLTVFKEKGQAGGEMCADDLLVASVRISESGSRRQKASKVIPPEISRHEALR